MERNDKRRKQMKIKDALDPLKACKKYEYDEAGFGKMFGRCCATCIHYHTKKCPKEKGYNK
jgi:hypothetical protein